MQRIGIFALTLLTVVAAFGQGDDIAGARAVFEANLKAIQEKNLDAYLSYYLHSPILVKTGPTGFTTGYDDFAKARGPWPVSFNAGDLQLTELQPGYVYGTYRYRVRYAEGDEHIGVSERLFVKTPAGWKIALTGAVDTPPGTPAPPRALVGATMIDGRGGAPVPNANVIVRDGKIDCAGTAVQCPVPEGVDVTNVSGMWMTPGLIDSHVHFSQTGWADGRPDSLDVRATHPYDKTEADLKANPERFGRSYVCSGVTSVWDVGGYPWTLRLHDRFENNTEVPHVVAAGPLMSTLDHWLNLPAERQFIVLKDAESARTGIDYLASQGSKAIKVWFIVTKDLPLEKTTPAVMAAGEEARKHNLPLIVHATGLAEAKVALRAGANVLVHSVQDLPVDQEFIDLAKKNGTILIPTLTVVDGYVRMFRGAADRKAPSVDDPNGCVDRGTLARVAESAAVDSSLVHADRIAAREQRAANIDRTASANLKTLINAGIPISTGTDAGNPLTLHGPAIYAEMDAMQAAGMTPMQVIVASTATASRAMGLGERVGTIEKGKDADLVIVGGDPSRDVANFRKIRYVVRSGVVRSIADLHALAQR
ncbi:MAG TPA: amidohydrolase family protein [Thermoanaerobaculia bacterium]|nr:amidohydrolase family protein [Thermoanaerobaculia bacterium]